jgi:hypothetical protein
MVQPVKLRKYLGPHLHIMGKVIAKLYLTHDSYANKVNAQVEKMIKTQLLISSDYQRVKSEADKAAIS